MNVILVSSFFTNLGLGFLSSVQVHSDYWPLVSLMPQPKVKTLAFFFNF